MTFSGTRRSLPALLLLCWGASACSTSTDGTVVETRPTGIEVGPQAFLGAIPCGDTPGALHSYVATLIDVTGETDPAFVDEFVLPSSGLVACHRSALFGFVVPGHLYAAEIQGYERTDLKPLKDGLPILVDPQSGEPVAPRWTTRCGRAPFAPIQARAQLLRPIDGCEPLVATGPATPTRVTVTFDAEQCATEPWSIERFVVRRAGESLGSAACDETLVLEDLIPGESVVLELLAFGMESDQPTLGAQCSARALPGVTIGATCEPLASTGSLAVDLPALLAALGMDCSPALDELVLELLDASAEPLWFSAATCSGSARFAELEPGEYTVRARAAVRGDARPAEAECSVTVEPGLSAAATCVPID